MAKKISQLTNTATVTLSTAQMEVVEGGNSRRVYVGTLFEQAGMLNVKSIDDSIDDGVTGASAAIQAAVDSLGTGGGRIYFPKPTVSYLIDTAIDLSGKSNIEFIGDGGVEFQTSNSTKLEAAAALTGPMFTCDTAVAARGGAFRFSKLHFDGNQQDVDAFYIHGSGVVNNQARFIEFNDCAFESLRTGAWLGDYTNETPKETYLLGINFYRCMLHDCVRPIVADAISFDGLHLEQVWMIDPNDRMVKPISVLTSGCTVVLDNVWLSCGDAVTHAVYCLLPTSLTMRNSAIEANDGGETFIGIYQGTGSISAGGVIIENTRIFHTAANPDAVDITNPAGVHINECYFEGNVKVGASTPVHADNVTFTSTYTYTSNPQNVFVDGEATAAFTPDITFATPGDLSVAYSLQRGFWSKKGKETTVHFEIITTTFTHSTATGNLQLSGFPFIAAAIYQPSNGLGIYSGITAAGSEHIGSSIQAGQNALIFYKSGSGVAQTNVDVGDMPSGGTVVLSGQLTFRATT